MLKAIPGLWWPHQAVWRKTFVPHTGHDLAYRYELFPPATINGQLCRSVDVFPCGGIDIADAWKPGGCLVAPSGPGVSLPESRVPFESTELATWKRRLGLQPTVAFCIPNQPWWFRVAGSTSRALRARDEDGFFTASVWTWPVPDTRLANIPTVFEPFDEGMRMLGLVAKSAAESKAELALAKTAWLAKAGSALSAPAAPPDADDPPRRFMLR